MTVLDDLDLAAFKQNVEDILNKISEHMKTVEMTAAEVKEIYDTVWPMIKAIVDAFEAIGAEISEDFKEVFTEVEDYFKSKGLMTDDTLQEMVDEINQIADEVSRDEEKT